jgi:hypothetical protein
MIGWFTIEKFENHNDSAGYATSVIASNNMDMNIKTRLYLPPYLRKSQCSINVGSTVFGIVDDVTGLGMALYGEGTADFGYFFDADITVKKNLTVTKDIDSTTGNIKATLGDVKATTISLKTHTHPILTMISTDAQQVVASATSGNPAEFTEFATTVPL